MQNSKQSEIKQLIDALNKLNKPHRGNNGRKRIFTERGKVRITPDVHSRLTQISEDTRVDKSALIRRIINKWLERLL